MSMDKEREDRLKQILQEAHQPVSEGKSTRRRKSESPISGIGNVVGDGNTVTNNVSVFPKPPVRKVIVQTGDDVVDAEQKFILKEAVKNIVDLEAKLKQNPRGFGAVWSAFNKRFRVSSYVELPKERFEEALKYLQTAAGRIKSAKSAPKKLGADFTAARITAIQARCREFPEGTARRKAYMMEKFGASSLTELDAAQLEQVYRHVFGWKR
jgi:hypothetical protein